MGPGTLLVNNYLPSYTTTGGAPVTVQSNTSVQGSVTSGLMSSRGFPPSTGSPCGETIEFQYTTGSGTTDGLGLGYVTSGPGQPLGYHHGMAVSKSVRCLTER